MKVRNGEWFYHDRASSRFVSFTFLLNQERIESQICWQTCGAPQNVTPQAHKIILAITRTILTSLLGTKLFPAR